MNRSRKKKSDSSRVHQKNKHTDMPSPIDRHVTLVARLAQDLLATGAAEH